MDNFYHSDRRPNCDSSSWNNIEGGADDQSHYLQPQATKSKRTYDCTFCKRGFTNAQALGGHMNIHRRDRAKAVKPIVVADEYGSPAGRFNYPAMDHHVHDHHQPSRDYNNHYLCFQQRHVAAGPRRSATVVPANCLSSDHGDLWGANLSLGIGSGGRKEDRELDLELRLGHIEP